MEKPTTEKTYDHLTFPVGLTPTDIKLIIKQCKIQDATEDHEVLGFAQAYIQAKKLFEDGEKFETITVEELEDLVLYWEKLIEPKDNRNGYRKVESRFADGSAGLAPNKIPRAMHVFCQAFKRQLSDGFSNEPDDWERPPLTPIDYYREFEEIHPFEDGNGRVGDLLWKIATQKKTGKWPEELPPKIFD